jgi:hypothetical protein
MAGLDQLIPLSIAKSLFFGLFPLMGDKNSVGNANHHLEPK